MHVLFIIRVIKSRRWDGWDV